MKPVIVDSTQCHLWTDALHARALAREARNKWDKGTYVRFCVITAWIALETSCQDALEENNISYSFRRNLDKSLNSKDLLPIDWSRGIWQQVTHIQNMRKDYIHRFLALRNMFPDSTVADNTISAVRDAIKDIYAKTGKNHPEWVELCGITGWDETSQVGSPTLVQSHFGASIEDPNTKRIYIVVNGKEKLTSVFPPGHDTTKIVDELVENLNVPIEAINVYECGTIVEEKRIMMRGN